MKNVSSNKRLKTIYFLEIISKEAEIEFHFFLFNKDFCDLVLKILAKRRKIKFQFLNRYVSTNEDL